jgi:hypothetical protein
MQVQHVTKLSATAPAANFKSEVLDALRGDFPEEPNLHPIELLADFLRDLEREDVMLRCCADDPDSWYDLLADVKLMHAKLAAINAAEPVPERR